MVVDVDSEGRDTFIESDNIGCKDGCSALIDSGTYLVYGPANVVRKIL